MPRLVEGLSRFFGRVEILALGLENERREAEIALGRGQALEAREHARTIVTSLPDSPLGLALWADAAEDAWLDHEVVAALTDLTKAVPWRADVWLRLGRAGLRIERPGAREALERAAVAPDEKESARLALLDLADLDLAAGDPARAQRWLDRIAPAITGALDRDVALRRAECAIARGDLPAAAEAAKGMGKPDADAPTDGRVALVRARLALAGGDPGAINLALRAYVLGEKAAEELLASLVASSRDVIVVDRARRVVGAAGELDEPAWAAAFALAEGRRDDARAALARGLAEGNKAAAASLLALAVETRDLDALDALATRDPALLPAGLTHLREASVLVRAGSTREALDKLDEVTGEAVTWADELRRETVARWIPPFSSGRGDEAEPTDWPSALHELRRTARFVDRLDLLSALEALAVERERPLRVAVVGEFNAGKSTFLNALLGEDVAPTGVLPTTATLHWVAWAPDPFARIVVRGAPDRVVQHEELKATLGELEHDHAKVERVFIYAPLERLKRVEILDTPGFNAPDPDHLAAARSAFDEAHVAIWLLDATGAMKETERLVLAEIKDLGVPVQILANKADRLKPDARDQVMAHVRESLTAVGLESYAEPIAFSARLSLRGKLGDAEALAASNWSAVEALISEQVVDRSERLRERALRRKAARIAGALAAEAHARAADDRERIRARVASNERQRSAAARLRRERQAIATAVDRALEEPRKLLGADLRPLGALQEERKRNDPSLREYLRERFVARLADPIAGELGKVATTGAPPRALHAVRAVLLGAVTAHDAPASLAERSLAPLIEACIEAFAGALAAEAESEGGGAPSAAIEMRAEAMRLALA